MRFSNFIMGGLYGFLAAVTAMWFDAGLVLVLVITLACALAGFFFGERAMRYIRELWGWT